MSDLNTYRTTPRSNKIDSATNNIPANFSTAAGSLALSGITRAQGIAIVNYTTSRLRVNYTHGSTASAPTVVEGYVPPRGTADFAASAKDNLLISSTVYIASDTGSPITSGVVTIEVW